MTAPADLTQHALDLVAAVLAGGEQAEYVAHTDALMTAPRDSLRVVLRLLLSVAGPDALADIRHMSAMHQLAHLEPVQGP